MTGEAPASPEQLFTVGLKFQECRLIKAFETGFLNYGRRGGGYGLLFNTVADAINCHAIIV